jgi:hypothetical protein
LAWQRLAALGAGLSTPPKLRVPRSFRHKSRRDCKFGVSIGYAEGVPQISPGQSGAAPAAERRPGGTVMHFGHSPERAKQTVVRLSRHKRCPNCFACRNCFAINHPQRFATKPWRDIWAQTVAQLFRPFRATPRHTTPTQGVGDAKTRVAFALGWFVVPFQGV